MIKTTCKKLYLVGLLVSVITAFFSEGYHHPDEHFQILEFCNYKLGNSPASDLAWEFQSQERQALPVFVAFVIIKGLYFLSITNPFTVAFSLRLSMGIASWFIISRLGMILMENFKTEKGKKLFVVITMFLWFIPYLNVRFSSENLSGTCFLFAIYFLLQAPLLNSWKSYGACTIAGLLLGFTFYFRFQMGFAIIGLGLWLLIVNRLVWKKLLLIVSGSIIAIFISVLIDYWFYGNWVFSPLNYFHAQIIQGVASNFGVDPWWYYFYLFFVQALPPLSVVLFLFFIFGLYKKPTNIFVWCIIPFLVAHFAVGHKEMRFLFPIAFGFIYIASLGIDTLILNKKYIKALKVLFVLCIIINTPLLLAKMFFPAQEAISYYKFLYNYSREKELALFSFEKDTYELVGVKSNFYRSKNVKTFILQNESEFTDYLNTKHPDSVYLLERRLNTDSKFPGYRNESIYCLLPKWVLAYNIGNWESRARIWDIRKISK